MASKPTNLAARPQPTPGTAQPGPDSAALNAAFEALTTYDAGSSRGSLEPIDAAVIVVLAQPRGRQELEPRLGDVLRTSASVWAREYVCAQLRLIGGAGSVQALSPLLADPQLADAARNALQTMTCPEALGALRRALPQLTGSLRLGVIDSLGKRRDGGSVSALTRLLEHSDEATAVAAAGALGGIGTSKAARALRKYLGSCPPAARVSVADACLVCAAHLRAEGKIDEARELCQGLTADHFPRHMREAALGAMSNPTQSQ